MPNRILRDGLRDSERIARLKDGEFRTFVLLITVCDDFGRYHGDPRLVKSGCYPFDNVNTTRIARDLEGIEKAGLIVVYTSESDGRLYLQMHRWDQRTRQKESRFPSSDGQATVKRRSIAHVDVDVDVDVDGDVKPKTKTRARPSNASDDKSIDDYSGIMDGKASPVALAFRITGEAYSPRAEGFYKKAIKEIGDVAFREVLATLWGELKTDDIKNPGAVLANKLKKRMVDP